MTRVDRGLRCLGLLALPLLLGAWGWQQQRCAEIFQPTKTFILSPQGEVGREPAMLINPGPLKRQELRLDYGGSESFQILRSINRLFVEYPVAWLLTPTRGGRNLDYAEVRVPESRWEEVFKEYRRWPEVVTRSYDEVINHLSKVEVNRVDIFESGAREVTFEGLFLKGHEIRTDEAGEPLLTFRFDRRVIELLEYLEEPAYANHSLERGLFRTRSYPPSPYY